MAAKPTVDLSEFFKLSRPRRRPCPVRHALETLSDSERAQFDAACQADAGVITNQALSLWLDRHAKDVWTGNWQNALAHRDNKCTCNDES